MKRYKYGYFKGIIRLIPPAFFIPLKVAGWPIGGFFDCEAKIDTGADRSAVPKWLVEKAKFDPSTDFKPVRGVDARETELPVHCVSVHCGSVSTRELTPFVRFVYETPLEYFILGRDILNHLVLQAYGPEADCAPDKDRGFFDLTV